MEAQFEAKFDGEDLAEVLEAAAAYIRANPLPKNAYFGIHDYGHSFLRGRYQFTISYTEYGQ